MKNNIILYFILAFLIVNEIYGKPLSKSAPKKHNKPDEQYKLFEGDMRFPPSATRGVFLRGNTVAWPNGVVPYVMEPEFEPEQEQFILNTMRKMETTLAVNNALCITFRPKVSSDRYYITIRNGDGCSSYVGYNANSFYEHTVSLQYPGCIDHGRIMHELLHTLGFYHEQSRPDRDSYVKIKHQNILSGMEYNFDKYDNSFVDTKNTPYDYDSVMHYEKDAFSTGEPTIEPNDASVQIGQRVWMSSLDVEEVRIAYNCYPNGMSPSITPATRRESRYSSALTTNDRMYGRPGQINSDYYYKTMQIVVERNGIYYIKSLSDMDTLGFLYDGTFNPLNSDSNIYQQDDDSGENSQFQIAAYLQAGVPYTLVFTTFSPRTTGSFSLVATGPGNVQYNSTGSIVTTPPPTTTRSAIINSYYSNALTSTSATFSRDGTSGSMYYYDAIVITVKTTGTYTLKSSSSFDTYGYLYQSNFYPSYQTYNLISSDDDSAGSSQFQLTNYLQSNTQYVLVFTTYGERITGQFSIIASGPDDVSFTQ